MSIEIDRGYWDWKLVKLYSLTLRHFVNILHVIHYVDTVSRCKNTKFVSVFLSIDCGFNVFHVNYTLKDTCGWKKQVLRKNLVEKI